MTIKNLYKIFAKVYDQNNHIEISTSFFEAIKKYLHLESDNPFLDLGCGSGLLTEKLASFGKNIIAVDISPEMINIAKKRCRRIKDQISFIETDLNNLKTPLKCSSAFACGDIINHISTKKELKLIFSNVFHSLQQKGEFYFDTLNKFCFERYWNDQTYHLENNFGNVIMDCSWRKDNYVGKCNMTIFIKRKNYYKKYKTTMYEYFYKSSTILNLLKSSGFSKVKKIPWSPWKDQNIEPSLDRFLWIARK